MREGKSKAGQRVAVLLYCYGAGQGFDCWFQADQALLGMSPLVQQAKEVDIPYQLEVPAAGHYRCGGDAIRAGVPSTYLSILCRYIHPHSEMADEGDDEGTEDAISPSFCV